MTEHLVSTTVGDDRLLDTLVRLHGIVSPELRPALDQTANLVAEALDADKVDVFLHDVVSDSLVALGTSQTPMGRRQQQLGLDRLPLANGGPTVAVYVTGGPYLQRWADDDPDELRSIGSGSGADRVGSRVWRPSSDDYHYPAHAPRDRGNHGRTAGGRA